MANKPSPSDLHQLSNEELLVLHGELSAKSEQQKLGWGRRVLNLFNATSLGFGTGTGSALALFVLRNGHEIDRALDAENITDSTKRIKTGLEIAQKALFDGAHDIATGKKPAEGDVSPYKNTKLFVAAGSLISVGATVLLTTLHNRRSRKHQKNESEAGLLHVERELSRRVAAEQQQASVQGAAI